MPKIPMKHAFFEAPMDAFGFAHVARAHAIPFPQGTVRVGFTFSIGGGHVEIENGPAATRSGLRKTAWKWCRNVLALWLFCKFWSTMLMLAPGPWGPTVEGVLPNGERIAFKSRFYGRETDDELSVHSSGRGEHVYIVNAVHAANISFVRIACQPDGRRVWLESNGKVVASLNLESDEFTSEGEKPAAWARLGEGITIAEGSTRRWWQFVVPW